MIVIMNDVEDIIYYLKSLKKGFDKDLFQNKVDHLSYIADNTGFEYDDFHKLFKLWLNLTIPITKWVSLGVCLVPHEGVQERTVDYALRWIQNNCEICEHQGTFSRTAFLLDWLTAAMNSNAIDLAALDSGYELLHNLLSFEVLTAHVVKLVYTLTKPSDVTRRRVLELLDHAKKREGKKNMVRQIQVVLGLFKSYKPECVPENIPAISVHTSFKKLNTNLVKRFDRCQERMATINHERDNLMWINPINSMSRRNKKAAPLVPNMEYNYIGSRQYAENESQKNYFDFADATSLLQYSLRVPLVPRPARQRALLCNETGLTLLSVASHTDQAFLSHDLNHLLTNCFLDASPYTWDEKQDLLHRLAVLQRNLLQGIPVVSDFLARFLQLWNEKDFFGEILELAELISVDSVEQISYIVTPLTQACHRAQPMQQCAILRSLSNMYRNLVFSSKRRRHHFLSTSPVSLGPEALSRLAACIAELSHNALQANPDDIRILYATLCSCEDMARVELRHSVPLNSLPRPLPLALSLVSPSAGVLDKVATLMMLYKKVLSMMKATNQLRNKEQAYEQRKMLESYTYDLINCLYNESAFTERKNSLIFNKLHPQLVSKLTDLVPAADARFSLKNHLAFARYTYMPSEVYSADATNKQCLDNVLGHTFENLGELLLKTIPELR